MMRFQVEAGSSASGSKQASVSPGPEDCPGCGSGEPSRGSSTRTKPRGCSPEAPGHSQEPCLAGGQTPPAPSGALRGLPILVRAWGLQLAPRQPHTGSKGAPNLTSGPTGRLSSRPQASPSHVLSDQRGGQGRSPRRGPGTAGPPGPAPHLGAAEQPKATASPGPGTLPTPSCPKGAARLEPGASTSDSGQGAAAGEGPSHTQEQPRSVHQSPPGTLWGEAWPRPHQTS